MLTEHFLSGLECVGGGPVSESRLKKIDGADFFIIIEKHLNYIIINSLRHINAKNQKFGKIKTNYTFKHTIKRIFTSQWEECFKINLS